MQPEAGDHNTHARCLLRKFLARILYMVGGTRALAWSTALADKSTATNVAVLAPTPSRFLELKCWQRAAESEEASGPGWGRAAGQTLIESPNIRATHDSSIPQLISIYLHLKNYVDCRNFA